MSDRDSIRISKFLSLILRHKPETVGLELDENGWASTEELLFKIKEKNFRIDLEELKAVVENNDKKRFALSPDFSKIRANQGHSLDVELGLSPKNPPNFLYHGTAEKNLISIKNTGINKGKRQHVHLSPDTSTATRVGMRYGKPVVLKILGGEMHDRGYKFFESENGVWLTSAIPPKFIEFPEER